MTLSANLPRVEKRLTEYLDHESSDRRVLKDALEHFSQSLSSLVIFGGMLREFALGRARAFTSDIDLVAIASSEEIYQATAAFSPVRNKFGGFRLYVEKWRFDIWAFEETWAFKRGLVPGAELPDLFNTTFFNLDAAFYDFTKRRLHCSDSYKEGIASRCLEVNLKTNPSPKSMALKAIRLAVDRDLSVGPQLADFILQHASGLELRGLYLSFVNHLYHHSRLRTGASFKFEVQQSIEI